MDEALAFHLQHAALCTEAVRLPRADLQPFLQSQAAIHCFGEYEYIDTPSDFPAVRYLLVLVEQRSEVQMGVRKLNLQPTVYMAIDATSNGLHHCMWPSAQFAPELIDGVQAQGNVCAVVDSLPMQGLFNLLGQGFTVVLAGHGFGGQVAHALAAKLLLQLRHEINLAKQMGINLSALSQTEDKVLSFGFSTPLFANAALQERLQQESLGSNLHTVWRSGDAAPHFLTLACEMAVQGTGQPATSPANSQRVAALQHWATAVESQLQQMPRWKVVKPLAAGPLDPLQLRKLMGGGSSGLEEGAGAEGEPEQDVRGSEGSGTAAKKLAAVALAARFANHSHNGTASTPRDGHQPRRSNSNIGMGPPSGERMSPGGRSAAALAGVRQAARQPSVGTSLGKAGLSSGSTSNKAAASGSTSPNLSLVSATAAAAAVAASKPGGGQGAAHVAAAAGQAASKSWQAALQDVLKCAPGCVEHYAPVGRFWLLQANSKSSGTAASAAAKARSGSTGGTKVAAAGIWPQMSKVVGSTKAAAAAAVAGPGDHGEESLVSLTPLSSSKVSTIGEAWLSEANKELFSAWELSMEETRRELMEVFPWVSFKPTLTVDGQLIDRKLLIKPGKTLSEYLG